MSDTLELLDAATLASLIAEYRAGNDPLVTRSDAAPCLRALGRPLAPGTVSDLGVGGGIVGGRAVARLSEYIAAADAYLAHRLALPNKKAAAVAKARAARQVAA